MFFPVARSAPLVEGVLGAGLAAGLAWKVASEYRQEHQALHKVPPADEARLHKALPLKEEDDTTRLFPLRIGFLTYNVDAQPPAALADGASANQTLLADLFRQLDSPDLIHFGLQEVIDLSNKRLEVETKLFATHHHPVSHSYRRWKDCLTTAVDSFFGAGAWLLVGEEKLVGLYSVVFARAPIAAEMGNIQFSRVKTGLRDKLGNKGSLAFRFTLADSSFCLLNSHLAAGQGNASERVRDTAEILATARFRTLTGDVEEGTLEEGDGSRVLDHEFVFLAGDLNARLDVDPGQREQVIAALAAPKPDLDILLEIDELLTEMSTPGSPLAAFCEQEVTHLATYKYDHYSGEYDTSKKRRVPAWCDRVLWRAREGKARGAGYGRLEADVSDHRPVWALFECEVKGVDEKELGRVRRALEGQLADGCMMEC